MGTNEKSKLVIRLTAPGASGPLPPRTLDPATRELIDKVQESGLANAIVLSYLTEVKGQELEYLSSLHYNKKLGPKKSRFSGPSPSNAPSNDVAALKTIKYKRHKTTGTLIVLCTRVLLCSVDVCCCMLLCVVVCCCV